MTCGVANTYFGLVYASVAALAIPPLETVAVNDVAASAVDGDVGTRNRDQGTCPWLVTKSSRALEGNLNRFSICFPPWMRNSR
jgi:hypothetical protein